VLANGRNLDIQQAQQRVEASRGQYEASVGAIFPSLTPGVTAVGIQGAVATGAGSAWRALGIFLPFAALQWIINLRARCLRTLFASKRRPRSLGAATRRRWNRRPRVLRQCSTTTSFWTQAQIAVTQQAMEEAEELLALSA